VHASEVFCLKGGGARVFIHRCLSAVGGAITPCHHQAFFGGLNILLGPEKGAESLRCLQPGAVSIFGNDACLQDIETLHLILAKGPRSDGYRDPGNNYHRPRAEHSGALGPS